MMAKGAHERSHASADVALQDRDDLSKTQADAPGRPRRRSRKSTDRRAAELSRSRGFYVGGHLQHAGIIYAILGFSCGTRRVGSRRYPGLTAYLRWVTRGEGTVSITCRLTCPNLMESNSRVPSPRTTGAMEMVNSFTSPALRYCWMRLAPPPIRMSRSPAAVLARARALSMPSLMKWKVVPPGRCHGARLV